MAYKGHIPWNKGKPMSEETKRRLSVSKKGKTHSIELRKKRSELWKKYYKEGRIKLPHRYGDKNPNWRGGISDKNHILRTSTRFKDWRERVFERDNYTCQKCGDDRGGNLHPHHIKFWHEYPDLRFEISNGITLCERCHREIHKGRNYGRN